MANSDLKVCVQNAKFIVFHINFRKFWNFGKFPNFFLSKVVLFFFSKNFFVKNIFLTIIFSKNFSLLSRPLHSIKVICTEKLSEKIWNGHFSPLQVSSNNFFQKDWYKLRMAKNGNSDFLSDKFSKKDWFSIQNGQKWPFQIFPKSFSQKDWYKF